MNATARAAKRLRYDAERLPERELCETCRAERAAGCRGARLEQQAHTLGRAPERGPPALGGGARPLLDRRPRRRKLSTSWDAGGRHQVAISSWCCHLCKRACSTPRRLRRCPRCPDCPRFRTHCLIIRRGGPTPAMPRLSGSVDSCPASDWRACTGAAEAGRRAALRRLPCRHAGGGITASTVQVLQRPEASEASAGSGTTACPNAAAGSDALLQQLQRRHCRHPRVAGARSHAVRIVGGSRSPPTSRGCWCRRCLVGTDVSRASTCSVGPGSIPLSQGR